MPHFPGIGHFLENPHSADGNSSCSSGVDCCYSGLAHCHLEVDLASSRHYISSWARHSQPTRAITGPSFHIWDYASWGASYRRGRDSWAIITTTSSTHQLIILIVSFVYISIMYFVYVCPLWNPIILILYIGITCIAYFPIVLTWIKVIQIYHFFITLSIILFLFPLLISFILFETCGSPINIQN